MNEYDDQNENVVLGDEEICDICGMPLWSGKDPLGWIKVVDQSPL